MKYIIYFIMCEQGRYVKIGHTIDKFLNQRLQNLQCGCPFKLKLIRKVYGLPWHEEWLHKQFAALHFPGELFNYCESMLTINLPSAEGGENHYPRHPSQWQLVKILEDIYAEAPYSTPYTPFALQSTLDPLEDK